MTQAAPPRPRTVEVVGAACAGCHHLELAVREAIARSGIEIELVLVKDYREIARRGAMSLPALVIDGVVVSSGRVPTIATIEAWLTAPEA